MSRRIRILALETVAVERARRAAYRALARIDECETHLLVPDRWREQGDVIEAETELDPLLHLHTSPIRFGFRQHRVLFTSLRRMLKDLQPDVLYADMEPENYAAVQCRLAVQSVSPHTRIALASCRNLDYNAIGFPYKLAFTHRWCDAQWRIRPADVIFVRPRSAMSLLEGYGRAVVPLPFPVDCDLFSPAAPASSPAPEGIQTIGFVGRLVEGKGVHHLLRAVATLPVSVHALIVGQGPQRDDLASLAGRLAISHRVRFIPAVPYSSVPGLLRSMDILVLPSLPTTHWVEQFGRVLIEAMACGTPIVASRSGEIPEVLGGGGLLMNPGDDEGLVQALESLLGDPVRRASLGATGRERALRHFSASVVAHSMRAAFLNCM